MRTIKRRRLEAKTDYNARFTMLKSGKPRMVVRKTSRYIIAQIVVSEIAQDKIVAGVNSNSLISKGWPEKSSVKNRAAAYLAGYALALKAKSSGIDEAILDSGMQRNVKKSKIYSVIKGALDAGLKIPCSPDSLPEMEMIKKNSSNFDKTLAKIKEEAK